MDHRFAPRNRVPATAAARPGTTCGRSDRARRTTSDRTSRRGRLVVSWRRDVRRRSFDCRRGSRGGRNRDGAPSRGIPIHPDLPRVPRVSRDPGRRRPTLTTTRCADGRWTWTVASRAVRRRLPCGRRVEPANDRSREASSRGTGATHAGASGRRLARADRGTEAGVRVVTAKPIAADLYFRRPSHFPGERAANRAHHDPTRIPRSVANCRSSIQTNEKE